MPSPAQNVSTTYPGVNTPTSLQGTTIGTTTYLFRESQARIPWRLDFALSAARTGSGTQDYYLISGRDTLSYTIDGTWAGSLQFQVSMDGVHWVNLGSAVTANPAGLTVVSGAWATYLDFSYSFTSGTMNLRLAVQRSG